MNNVFTPKDIEDSSIQTSSNKKSMHIPDYTVSQSGMIDHVLSFALGFLGGFIVLFFFYKIIILSILGGTFFGVINIFLADQKSIDNRIKKLRTQFFDLLEAMSVALRAGNPPLKALESAKEDLMLIYAADSDIITELDIIIGKFYNGVALSEVFLDLAKRSQLEDIESFASIYSTIEGKSSRADQVINDTQAIIADKMEIEMEIDTLMMAAKTEVNIMLVMPIVILGVIGYAGAGFMDVIYTTPIGRATATGGLIVFIFSYFLARKIASIKL